MAPMQRQPLGTAVLLAVSLNGLLVDDGMLFIQDAAGNLYAPASFFTRWNLLQSTSVMAGPDDADYYLLAGDKGVSYQWNHERGELALTAGQAAFHSSQINIGSDRVKDAAPYTTGGYLNYDLAFTQTQQAETKGGFFELAYFSGKGLFTNSLLATDSAHARLMTTWQTDRVDSGQTLRIGDSYSAGSAWGLGVLYGGIQYGTNFELRPEYIPFAMPSVMGNALLPSTVDVYVNNALRSRQQVNAGPFQIQNLPVITGSGEMQIIVKDLLGREQVMTESFYVNPILLRSGLSSHSFEFGRQRKHYGVLSNEYKDAFATATYRVGVSDSLTTEGRVELQNHTQTAGITVATKLSGMASVVEASAAVSNGEGASPGTMTGARFNYQGPHWSFNARLQLNSASFRQLGSDPNSLPKQIVATQLSTPLHGGTLSVNYLRRLNQGESLNRIINLSYSRRLFGSLLASFTLLKPLAGAGDTVAQFTLTHVFGNKNIGSVSLDSQPGSAGLYTQYQQTTPRERGTGYRLAVMNGGNVPRQEAQVSRNESFGSFQAEFANVADETSTRQMVQGSIATIGDGVFFTRTLDQGFAIVETREMAGVPVMLENQIVAHTDARGRALVTNLQAYQPNHVSIDPLALPLESSVGAIEQTVIPRRSGSVLVNFDVHRKRSATLVIVLPDGALLPPWTPVTVSGMSSEYISGSRGEVFVDLPYLTNNLIKARLADGEDCTLRIDQPAANAIAPFLGPLQCTLPTY